MFKISIVANKKEQVSELSVELANRGFFCSISSGDNESIEKIISQPPDLVIAVGDVLLDSEIRLLQRIKQEANLPLIALISIDSLDLVDSDIYIDDFVVEPWQVNEVITRAKRVPRRIDTPSHKKPIDSGDLVIDQDSREVIFKGSRVELTFREYELLAFLASNKGKVFSREDLLHTVWDIDYYGGGRTVDVHVRRLRSKCGDSCIETVRNIGYRFRDD